MTAYMYVTKCQDEEIGLVLVSEVYGAIFKWKRMFSTLTHVYMCYVVTIGVSNEVKPCMSLITPGILSETCGFTKVIWFTRRQAEKMVLPSGTYCIPRHDCLLRKGVLSFLASSACLTSDCDVLVAMFIV